MTEHTITLTGSELGDLIFALHTAAADRRNFVKTCGDIASLADQKASYQAEAERLDALASKINLQV